MQVRSARSQACGGARRLGSPGQAILVVHGGHDAVLQVLGRPRAGTQGPTRGSQNKRGAAGPGAQEQARHHRPGRQRRLWNAAAEGVPKQARPLPSRPGTQCQELNVQLVHLCPHGHFRAQTGGGANTLPSPRARPHCGHAHERAPPTRAGSRP